MNFQVGNLMNCPSQLDVTSTIYPQQLGFVDPVEVIPNLRDPKQSRSPGRTLLFFYYTTCGH
jgi:hypothetical protein